MTQSKFLFSPTILLLSIALAFSVNSAASADDIAKGVVSFGSQSTDKFGYGKVKLVRHVRFSSGFKFSDAKSLRQSVENIKNLVNRAGRAVGTRFLESSLAEVKKLQNPKSLPKCGTSRESKLDLKFKEDIPHEVIVEDLLFLGSDPPFDSESRFGESVMIQVLDSNSILAAPGFETSFGVKCLPYRIRTTTRAIYRFEGEAALKRYEEILGEDAKG